MIKRSLRNGVTGQSPARLAVVGSDIRSGLFSFLLLLLLGGGSGRTDDEVIPPVDPGTGFEGILPNPPLPPYLTVDQRTSPYGVGQVFNTPETVMGQSFTPLQGAIDWVAFVFQNNPQPNTEPGPGVLRAKVFTTLDGRTGVLSGLLGESDEVSIPASTTAWLIFSFPQPIPVTPGVRYYCHLELVRGYPSWVGGRLQDFYSRGGAFGYLPNPFGGPIQDLNWGRYDLVFAHGTGRGATGVTPGELIQWGLPHGLVNYHELGDPDDDRHNTFVEFLRDTNPMGNSGPAKSRAHFVDVSGERYFAWTVAVPARFEHAEAPDGAIGARTGQATDVFTPSAKVPGLSLPGLSLVEVVPAVVEGLPAVSRFHRYRTFRFSQPVSSVPHGFILNHVRIEDD